VPHVPAQVSDVAKCEEIS